MSNVSEFIAVETLDVTIAIRLYGDSPSETSSVGFATLLTSIGIYCGNLLITEFVLVVLSLKTHDLI